MKNLNLIGILDASTSARKKKLITSILELLDTMRMVIIRAIFQTGKSILFPLLDHHIFHERRELEPVFINWETREKRKKSFIHRIFET